MAVLISLRILAHMHEIRPVLSRIQSWLSHIVMWNQMHQTETYVAHTQAQINQIADSFEQNWKKLRIINPAEFAFLRILLIYTSILVYDSSTKYPEGILASNGYSMGHYDQCVGSRISAFSGKYCLVNVHYAKINESAPQVKTLSLFYNYRTNAKFNEIISKLEVFLVASNLARYNLKKIK